jgi:hypothetical protein
MRLRFLCTIRLLAGAGLVIASLTGCAERAPKVALPEPVPVVEWAERVDTLPGTYTRVMRPAEFWDSVLVVPDVAERLLWRIDMATGTREELGTRGGGPGEYGRVSWAAKIHGDSVAILQGSSWIPFPIISVATGRGRTVSWRPNHDMDRVKESVLSVSQPWLQHGDTLGHVYAERITHPTEFDSVSGRPIPGSGGLRDTVALVRFSVRSDAVDTLLQFPRGVHSTPTRFASDGAMLFGMGLGPYGPTNTWTVTADGRLWLVDAARYQVRVLDQQLRETADRSFTSDSIPVSTDGWDAYVQRTTNGSIELLEKTMEGVAAQMGKPMKRSAAPRYVVPPMPSSLPPVIAPSGTVQMHAFDDIAWIPVSRVDPPETEYWDIVDMARGERLATVSLPANHRLVHVTKRGAYIVAKDDDDLERILLYRPPGSVTRPQ